MKVLFVPDIHCKMYMFDDVEKLDKLYDFDKVIFLGDYVDDWNCNGQDSIECLNKLISLLDSNPKKYIACIGNHDAAYLWKFGCSGNSEEYFEQIHNLLEANKEKFYIYYSIQLGTEQYVCSHAGFSQEWLDYHNITDLSNLGKEWTQHPEQFWTIGKLSGGYELSGPLWLRPDEIRSLPSFKQIVGHTPVKTIQPYYDYVIVDTHSTYPDGSRYGDQNYLMWDGKKFQEVQGCLQD